MKLVCVAVRGVLHCQVPDGKLLKTIWPAPALGWGVGGASAHGPASPCLPYALCALHPDG